MDKREAIESLRALGIDNINEDHSRLYFSATNASGDYDVRCCAMGRLDGSIYGWKRSADADWEAYDTLDALLEDL